MPASVTTPLLTATAMSVGSKSGSHRNSSSTSRLISWSDLMIATPPVDYPQRGYVQISGRGTPTNKPASAHCVDGRQVQRIIRQSPETLDVYPYAVVSAGNAGPPPRRPLCLFALRPGAHGPPQYDLSAVSLDGDTACVEFCGAPQRFLDFSLDVDRRDQRPDVNVVVDVFDASHAPNCFFCQVTLIVPLDLALELDPSIFDNEAYFFPGKREVVFYLLDSITGDFRIRPAVDYG